MVPPRRAAGAYSKPVDTISFRPDRPPRRWLPGPRWPGPRWPVWRRVAARLSGRAWLLILAATTVVAGGLFVLTTHAGGHRRAGVPVADATPLVLTGVPARSVRTNLVIGGDYLWRVGGGRPRAAFGGLLFNGLSPLLRGTDGAGVSQIAPVPGGVIALLSGNSSNGTGGNRGVVLFIPAGAGRVRLIARASAFVVAPGGRSVWLQTAVQHSSGPPTAKSKAAISPTFAVSLAGRRVSPVLRLPLGLVAATSAGLLTDSVVTGQLQRWNTATGRQERVSLPGDAQVVGEGSGVVIWQPPSCPVHCRLRVTDLRTRGGITMRLPEGWWPVQYQEPVASDPSGRRFAIPLAQVDPSGNPTEEDLYVIDTAARTVRRIPGGPSAPDQPLGLGDPEVELAGAWDQNGRLWALATSGYGYFQLGYWPGAGPLHVYPPAPGNPAAISAPGPG